MDFSNLLKPGISDQKDEVVTDKNSAAALGSGGIDVFSTPSMIALMERAAYSAVQNLLPAGWSTVGTDVNIKHLSATPLGMKVHATAELLNVDGRALSFKVEAFDEAGKIGEGTHDRFIIEVEKFISKTNGKKV